LPIRSNDTARISNHVEKRHYFQITVQLGCTQDKGITILRSTRNVVAFSATPLWEPLIWHSKSVSIFCS